MTYELILPWHCDRCPAFGEITHPRDADKAVIQSRLDDAHALASPECAAVVGGAFVRAVPLRTFRRYRAMGDSA